MNIDEDDGKSKNPRCLAKYSKANLGVTYLSNGKSWMTGFLFNEWLQTLDKN